MWELNPHILLGRQSYYHYTNGARGVKPQTSHHRVRPDRMFFALNTSFGVGKDIIVGPPHSVGLLLPIGSFLLLLEIVLKKMSTSISQHPAELHFPLQSTYSLSTYRNCPGWNRTNFVCFRGHGFRDRLSATDRRAPRIGLFRGTTHKPLNYQLNTSLRTSKR